MLDKERSRNVASIGYLDSFQYSKFVHDIQEDSELSCSISPLHHHECNDDGSQKKWHFHILMHSVNAKSGRTWRNILEKYGLVGVEKVSNYNAYGRYLTHYDERDKPKYQLKDIQYVNNPPLIAYDKKIDIDFITFCKYFQNNNYHTLYECVIGCEATNDTEMYNFITKNMSKCDKLIISYNVYLTHRKDI